MNSIINEDAIKNNLPTKQHILKIFQTINPELQSIYNKEFIHNNLNRIILNDKFGYYVTIEILFQLLRNTEEERYFSTTNEADKHNFDIYLLAVNHSESIQTHPSLSSIKNKNNKDITLLELKEFIIKDCNFICTFNKYFKTYKNKIVNPNDKELETVNELEINKKLLYIVYSLYTNKEVFSLVLVEETLLLLQNIIQILLPDVYTYTETHNNINNIIKRNIIIMGAVYANLLMDIKDIDNIGGIHTINNLRAISIILLYSLDNAHHELLEYKILVVLTNLSSYGNKEEGNKLKKYFFEDNNFMFIMENRLCSDNYKIVCSVLQCINNCIICLDLLNYLHYNNKKNKLKMVISVIIKYLKVEDDKIVFEAVKFIYIVLYNVIKSGSMYKDILDILLKEGILINLNVLYKCYKDNNNNNNNNNGNIIEMIEDCLGLLKELGHCINF